MVSRRRASSSSSISTAKAAVIGLVPKLATAVQKPLLAVSLYTSVPAVHKMSFRPTRRAPTSQRTCARKPSGGMDAALIFRVEYDCRRRGRRFGVGDERSGRGRD